jgi:hypothetical protein
MLAAMLQVTCAAAEWLTALRQRSDIPTFSLPANFYGKSTK